MAKQILIKPLVTEKTTRLSEDSTLNQYSFVVARDANKIEIKKAIEEKYSVSVDGVRTIVMPAKAKTRFVNGRMTSGRKSAFKKAIVSVKPGDIIDIYGDA